MSCFYIFNLDQATVEELINHPVHITDTKSISSFIPFCSFGNHTNGKFVGNISLPVCDLFREKIINGQLCYQADVDDYMKGIDDWMQTLGTGFNFIIDFNEEYDVKNIITNNTSTESVQHSASYHSGAAYKGKSLKFSYVKWTCGTK